jgi:hypothetical protein
MSTIEDYYAGDTGGQYQYVSFQSMIDDFVEDSLDQDSYLKNTTRSQIVKQTIKGVRMLNFNGLNAVKGLELQVPPSLSMLLPVDYVDWIRVTTVGDDGFLYNLGENLRMPTAVSYLQDNDYEILFDNDGNPLQGDSDNSAFSKPFLRRTLHETAREEFLYGVGCRQVRRNIDTSKYSENGEFKIDQQRGAIAFSSELAERSVVFEYVSDGLEEKKIWGGEYQIHKYTIDAIHDYVYWQLIRKKRNVNATEKATARGEYFNSRRIAIKRLGSINVNQIMKAMSSATKWI